MYFNGSSSGDGVHEPSLSCSSRTICTGAHPTETAAPRSIEGQHQSWSLSSYLSFYSWRITSSLGGFFSGAHATIRNVFERDGGDGVRNCNVMGGSFLFPSAVARSFNAWYEALATTRVCAMFLPRDVDGPLVIHLTLLFVSWEVMQSTSLYLRYRRAMRIGTKNEGAPTLECDNNAAKTVKPSDFSTLLEPITTDMRSHTQIESVQSEESSLSSNCPRAVQRLCNYWALIEKAVLSAPRKHAGAPTKAADFSWFLRSGLASRKSNKGGGHRGASRPFTWNGAPRDTGTVLVLSEEAAFPVLTMPPGEWKTMPDPALGAVSTPVNLPLSGADVPEAGSLPKAQNVVQVAEPWKVIHLLWTDRVRYSVTYTELRRLLLGCSVAEISTLFHNGGDVDSCRGRLSSTHGTRVLHPIWSCGTSPNLSDDTRACRPHCETSLTSQGISPSGCTDPRVVFACVALTWYLSLVRDVYDAIIIHEDVQRCTDALEELEEYSGDVYRHGIQVGLPFFKEALQSISYEGVADARCGSSGECLDVQPHSHEHAMMTLEIVNTTGEKAEHATTTSAVSMEAVVHVSGGPERGGNNLTRRDACGTPPIISVSPRSREQCLLVTGTYMPLRVASPWACWAELTAVLAALRRRRRLMRLLHVRSLFSYMHTGSVAKTVSFLVLAGLTCISSRVAAAGQVAREAISSNLDTHYRAQGGLWTAVGDSNRGTQPSPGVGMTAQQRILALCLFECMRLTVNTVLTRTTHAYIQMAASQRRNSAKVELYEALTRLPLTFFDTHSFDEVEQIVYYVNDIEGVEVHVHRYVCGLVMSICAVQHAVCQLPCRARLLVGATVAVSLTVKAIGQGVKKWVQGAQRTGGVFPKWLRGYQLNGGEPGMAELDAEVEENTESNARHGGVMLRGLDIVAVLPQLRPYAADLSLMRWWTHHIHAYNTAGGSTEASAFVQGLCGLPLQAYGQLLPALGGALMTFADWVLPTLVASYGGSMALCSVEALSLSNRLIEAMRCVSDTIDVLVDGRRVTEVVLCNAYKANVLEKVMDARQWEPTSAKYAKGFIVGGEGKGHHCDHKYHYGSAGFGRHAAEMRSPSSNHHRRLLRLLQRANTQTVEASPPSGILCLVRALKHTCCCCVPHMPPTLFFGGCLRFLRRGLAGVGIAEKDSLGSRRPQSPKRSQHHRRSKRSRHVSSRWWAQPHQENPQTPKHRQSLRCGSVSDATATHLDHHASEDDSLHGGDAGSSLSSFSDGSNNGRQAAAAAAVALLASATVHAVTVRSMQFCYPTAPTVPVFSRPVTFSFALQGNREAAAPSPSSASELQTDKRGGGSRGRLVCLVGPSGHGKSTLLSLLLGMYTHFSSSSHVLGEDNDVSIDGVDRVEAQDQGEELYTSSPLPDPPDIVLTLALPCSPAYPSEEPTSAGSHDSTSTTAASMMADVVHEQMSVASIPRDILRGKLFSFVPQSPVIFSGSTIAHNISLENYVSLEQEALLAEIAQCAAWAHCEYIQRFPQGLMTYIVDSGTGAWSSSLMTSGTEGGGAGAGGGVVRLSIGQAQRLMMARALFHGRRGGTVLVMDEPTASLDKEVKLKILDEWRELLDSGIVRGAICATHDEDLIAVADEVVTLP
ncbi:hypothetical protein, conserved [Leishmania tarentolae]|uniref:AAA+ ATPase domain-containing protein n=1 Tax=Leishmania tarentolae TaxID=5689 RepID=A0A640KH53_LEITA|nr:hypothetical protein, conserved [Leishmania tarentolae]